jgi:hypothetical protein
LTEVNLLIRIKRTPQQYEKSNNGAQGGEQYSVALRQRNHEKSQNKNLTYIKVTYLCLKKKTNIEG